MEWTPEKRIVVATKIARALRGTNPPHRDAELKELILFVLSMPEAFINMNADKFAEWL